MALGEATIKVTADASGVETGVGRARKSLATLSQTAGQTADSMSQANERTARSIDRFVQKQQLAAATLGKTATEAKLFELAQRGASAAQLKSAESALRAVDAYNRQEAASVRAQAAAARFGAVIAAGSVLAAAAILNIGRNSVNALDQFNDLADATGASVEGISALDRVARENGQAFESTAPILVRFNKVLSDTDDEGKKAAQVMKALGLDAAALKQLDPAEALRQTAVALSKFANDGDKARAVQLLFGKSVQEAAPFLKDLAEKTELVGTTSTKTAQEAEEFNKNLNRLKANASDLARALMGDLLPALNAVAGGMQQGGLLGFLTTGGDQTADPGKALSVINDKLATMKKLRDELDPSKGVANKINDFVFGDVGDLNKQIELLEKQRGYLQVLQAQLALGGAGDTSDALSRSLVPRGIGSIPDAPKGGSKKDPFADGKQYLESLKKQLQTVKEMTVYEKLMDDIRAKRFAVTPELQKELEAAAQKLDTTRAQAKSEEDVARARAGAAQIDQQANEALRGSIGQHVEGNQQLREEIELLGLEGTARVAVEQARMSSAIALKEEALIVERSKEGNEERVLLLERELRLLQERQRLTGLRATMQEGIDLSKATEKEREQFASDVKSDLSGAFQAAFSSADNPAKAFALSLASTVQQRLSAALADSMASAILGKGGAGGLLGSLFSRGSGFTAARGFGAGIAPNGEYYGSLDFEGGGYTGNGPRSGGLDGKGGFMAMLHPKETVLDHTKGQAVGGGAAPITIIQNISTTDTVSKTELEAKLRNSKRELVAALDRSERYGRR
jgi:hypothetical protein